MMEYDELLQIIRREAAAAVHHENTRKGTVTSYDAKAHAVKLKLRPTGIETGWIPVGTQSVGDGYGLAIGPVVGDLMTIEFDNGDPNSPIATHRLFSKKAKPPQVESGEVVIISKFKHSVKMTKDGKTAISTEGDISIKTTGAIAVEGDGAVTVTGSPVNLIGK